MSRFKKTLAIFLAGLPYAPTGAHANIPRPNHDPSVDDSLAPVDLRPLNGLASNLFAAHRSHQSHSSHGSHRSSSGTTPRPVPTPSPPPSSRPVDPGRPAQVSPQPARPPELSREEKLRLQVMRVQIALTDLGLYSGTIDGVLGEGTKTALKRFQTIKGLTPDGLMSNPTLQALGIAPVQ